jgi:protein-disulfide isomerase
MRVLLILLLLILLLSCTNKHLNQNKETGKFTDINNGNTETSSKIHILGNKTAGIDIMIFSDFECPYSKNFYNEILPQLKAEYINTGRAYLIFKHLPLRSIHPNAHKAAEATECAGMQGKFWEMHNLMFERGVSGGVEDFKRFAAQLGLNTSLFDECIDSNMTRQTVIDNFNEGISLGVKGTPTIIIKGMVLAPVKDYPTLNIYLNSTID